MADDVPQTDAPPAPAARPQYEFTAAENEVFESLSSGLRGGGWGVIALVAAYHAILLGRWALTGHAMYDRFRVAYLWLPLVLVLASAALIRAGRAFGRVASTQGSDITHLMTGLREVDEVIGWLPLTWVVFAFAIALGGIAAALHVSGF